MSSTAETVLDAREVFAARELRRFGSLLEERVTLKAQMKEAEAQIKELDTAITQLLTEHDATKVQYDDKKVQLCQGSRSTLSKDRLVELGVAARIIQEATTVTSYNYLLVK